MARSSQPYTTPASESHESHNPHPIASQRFDSPLQEPEPVRRSPSLRSVRTATRGSRPPTAHGGPLGSHPALDNNDVPPIPGAFPPSPPLRPHHRANGAMSSDSARDTSGSFVAPAAENHIPTRRPSGVRRLFSLSSLRQSFSSSRTSFSIPPGSSYGNQPDPHARPRTSGAMSFAASVRAPSTYSTNKPATLRKKRSSTWFKRKSGFFNINEDGMLEAVGEDSPESRQAKRLKENRLPVLPEVSTLVELNDGSLGWDDAIFQK